MALILHKYYIRIFIFKKGLKIMKSTSHLKNIKFFTLLFGCIGLSAQDSFIEEVFVTAEKRSESLQIYLKR